MEVTGLSAARNAFVVDTAALLGHADWSRISGAGRGLSGSSDRPRWHRPGLVVRFRCRPVYPHARPAMCSAPVRRRGTVAPWCGSTG